MMNYWYNFCYLLSSYALDFAIWILPDAYTQERLRYGIYLSAEMMLNELGELDD